MNQSNKLLSDIASFRTYSKHLPHLGRRESLEETINRDMVMHLDKFPKLSRDIIKAFQKVHESKIMPSMRGLQFAGDAVLKNNIRQYNCSYTPIDHVKCFSEVLFLLLSGVGVGFSVQGRHTKRLPIIGNPREEGRFIIHDSILGWAQAVDALMDAYFNNSIRPMFDYTQIRPKGSYLVTTGAKAPGSEALKYMLQIVEDKLKRAKGRHLRPIEVHDIICLISDCVLSGGIRRAALISLFDRDDTEMLKAKSGDWWIKHPYRARSNNSAILPRTISKEEFLSVFKACKDSGAGEPGFSFTNDEDWGFNPCVSGDTEVLTKEGNLRIDSLVGRSVEIWNGWEWSNVEPKVTGLKQPMIIVTFSNGKKLRCTEYHKFYLHGVYVGQKEDKIARQLELGDCLIDWIDPNGNPSGTVRVTGLQQDGCDAKVYCFNEPKRHMGIFGGVITGQCHEVSLRPNQFCNLSTINQTEVRSEKEFLDRVYSATLIGTLQAAYTDFPFLRSKWKHTTEMDALIGVSFTGIADASGIVTPQLLEKGAKLVLEVNEKYARKLGINSAARTTVVKPEGTSSAVLGSSSGIHARHAEYYLRRIRMNKNDALSNYLSSVIPDLVEDDVTSSNGVVVTIPQESPKSSIIRGNESALDLFNRAMIYNKHWIAPGHQNGVNTNNVSCTISVKDNEWDGLAESMWENKDIYSGISLLPYDGGNYKQAPFEECTKEKYEELSKLVKDIDLKQVKEDDDNTNRMESVACSGGSCEIV